MIGTIKGNDVHLHEPGEGITETRGTGAEFVIYDRWVDSLRPCPFCGGSSNYRIRQGEARKHSRCSWCGMTWDGPVFER